MPPDTLEVIRLMLSVAAILAAGLGVAGWGLMMMQIQKMERK